MTRWFAAVDSGVARGETGTGAVYGVGQTEAEALAEALTQFPREGEGGSKSTFDTVPCTAAAASLVRRAGGGPGTVRVSRTGVTLRDE